MVSRQRQYLWKPTPTTFNQRAEQDSGAPGGNEKRPVIIKPKAFNPKDNITITTQRP
jgi:hypothetical protein